MTISLDAVAEYLDKEFSALATAIGQDADPSIGFEPDIHNALRKLGVTEDNLYAATVADTDRDAMFALSKFYAAQRIWQQLGDRADHTMGETTYKYDGQRKQAEAMMKNAAKVCAALGYDVLPTNPNLVPASTSTLLRAGW